MDEKKNNAIENARRIVFSESILGGFSFKRVSADDFWQAYAADFHQHAPLDLFFDEAKLRSTEQTIKFESLLFEDNYLIVSPENKIVAMMRGWPKNTNDYYMQFSVVHKDYRRKKIYSAMIDAMLLYTKILGFTQVSSCHAPFNNSVLIAKMKKGFVITGFDINISLGLNIVLSYFHDDSFKKAFEFRCGSIAFNERMFSSSHGTAESLLCSIDKSKKAD